MARSEAYSNTKAAIDAAPTEILDKGRNTVSRANQHGLTDKQEMFAQGVAKGLTLKAAYIASYNVEKMSEATIYSEASRMMDNPAIGARVKALMAQRQERHDLDAMRIRRHVLDRLMIESVEDESPPSARIRALELLGKVDVVSMFKEQRGNGDDTGKLDEAELQAKLRDMLGRMVDITPGTKASQDD